MSHKKTTKPTELQSERSIPSYSGPTYGPFTRACVLAGALVLGGAVTQGLFAEHPELAIRIAVCVSDVLFLGLIMILFLCNYTEINDQKIATYSRIGSFFRREFKSVSWDDVRHAEFRISQAHNTSNTAVLRLYTVDDKLVTFNASSIGELASHFESIARKFPKRET
ncbi:MAG TPA: hypothetical protein VH280_06220 [Verrucomicrobiae bacterium]|jgi:hypothetical protein|nr:hypothetical protein [Verrucomicrobiae bacterium]